MSRHFTIPSEISHVTGTLERAGFEAYLVGGCVRDLYRGVAPKDWDITTNATPDEIIALFPKTFYENEYGTVGVVNEDITEDDTNRGSMRVVEVTPYRKETTYTNFRHPDEVIFSGKLEDDLLRRDFTMNAIGYSVSKKEIIDPYDGERDIERHLIKTVGKPSDRFHEDALRVMRAVRFGAELGFAIEMETMSAVVEFAHRLDHIAAERIRDEFEKIIMSDRPMEGIILLHRTGVLKYIIPELEAGLGCEQNGDHIYEVWEHNLRALEHAKERGWPLHVRVAALLHDVAKPHTRKWSDEKKDWTFYGHDVVGGRMAKKILERLRFPKKFVEDVTLLVRYHLFFSDIEKITLSAVRRIVANVGPERVWDLMDVRACDRIGMGRPKETPYRLRKYHSMIEEAMRAPVSVGMLKIDGAKIMKILDIKPGREIGWILHALFNEVLDIPERNTSEYLEGRAKDLIKLDSKELEKLGEAGKEKKEEKEEAEVGEIRKRYGVK
ncbi:MAG: PolyA polymerase [Parcubacteria group bacterium GW2011_GWA2_47_7]|nr:MAG: PolyA polymerase [Parcubacteria group bacterium GW2011_GWA2_47_7]